MIREQVGILEVGGSVWSELHTNGQVARGLAYIPRVDGWGRAWDVGDGSVIFHASIG